MGAKNGFPHLSMLLDFIDFRFFVVGFGVWEGLESIDTGIGIQMDGFSAQTEPYDSIFDDFHDFAIVFGGLTLLPEGPRTLRECPEVPGPCERVSCPTGPN